MKRRTEYVSDGCTWFLDGNWRCCCEAHDIDYRQGGTPLERLVSDASLLLCVAERASAHVGIVLGALLGLVMFLVVRFTGHPLIPVRWRWGFGRSWTWRGWGYGSCLQRSRP